MFFLQSLHCVVPAEGHVCDSWLLSFLVLQSRFMATILHSHTFCILQNRLQSLAAVSFHYAVPAARLVCDIWPSFTIAVQFRGEVSVKSFFFVC